jgi:hypothetical protein
VVALLSFENVSRHESIPNLISWNYKLFSLYWSSEKILEAQARVRGVSCSLTTRVEGAISSLMIIFAGFFHYRLFIISIMVIKIFIILKMT